MLLTDEEYGARQGELQNIKVSLDADILSTGVTGINRKISELQGQKDRVSSMLMEAIRNKAEAQILHDTCKGLYERKLYTLLVSDADVQAQKTEKLREAMANTKISQEVLSVTYAEIELIKADAYYKGLLQMYENLESANSNISRQISVIQMSLDLGEIHRSDLGSILSQGKEVTFTPK